MTDHSLLSIRFSTETSDYLAAVAILLLAAGLSAGIAFWSRFRMKKNPDSLRGNSWNPVIRSSVWLVAIGYSFSKVIIIPSDGWWILILFLFVMIFIGMAGPIRNMISGFWISAGRYLAPGDQITIGPWNGEVAATGVFYVSVIDDSGRLIRIPNQECFRQTVVINPPNNTEKLELVIAVPVDGGENLSDFLLECVLSSPSCSLNRKPVITRIPEERPGYLSCKIEAWAVSRDKTAALKGEIIAFADSLIRTPVKGHELDPSR